MSNSRVDPGDGTSIREARLAPRFELMVDDRGVTATQNLHLQRAEQALHNSTTWGYRETLAVVRNVKAFDRIWDYNNGRDHAGARIRDDATDSKICSDFHVAVEVVGGAIQGRVYRSSCWSTPCYEASAADKVLHDMCLYWECDGTGQHSQSALRIRIGGFHEQLCSDWSLNLSMPECRAQMLKYDCDVELPMRTITLGSNSRQALFIGRKSATYTRIPKSLPNHTTALGTVLNRVVSDQTLHGTVRVFTMNTF